MPIYEWFDSDDEINLPGCESEQGFDQASEMMNGEKVNLKDESQQVHSQSESGSDEFDASGYYVGKRIKSRMRYEFSDSSVPFSGSGIVLKETESDSGSYDSDVTSKPSCFGDEFNDVLDETETESDQGGDNYKANLEIESEHVETETESGSDEFDASGYYVGKKIRRPAVYEFSDSSVTFSGFGIVLDHTETETESESSSCNSDATSKPSESLEFRCIRRRKNVLGKRGFLIECGSSVSSEPCIKKRKVSSKRDSAVGWDESIESGITRTSVSGKRS